MKLLFTLLGLLLTSLAAAQTGDSATWQGQRDGVRVRVIVVARGHTIPPARQQTQPWWRWGNTTTDAYLFGFGPDDGTDIVLDFAPSTTRPGVTRAALYRLTGRHRFEIAPQAGAEASFVVPSSIVPRFTVQPRRGGWWVGGQPTFNLETERFEPFGDTFLEYQGSVRAAAPGVPLWSQSRLVNDVSPSSGYPRFNAAVRADPSVPFRLAVPLMPSWPYLSVTPERLHWGPSRPLVYETRTRRFSEFWSGFHIAGSYQFNSLSYPPQTDFEAPFAFYRFDPEAGNYANLVVRSDVWPASSPFGPPIPGVPRTAVRMTWTGQERDLWRYSLTLLGNHRMTERIAIGQTWVRAVPYEAFPTWVSERSWKLATFVEDTAGEPGSEGIYDYSLEDNYPMSLWAQGLRLHFPKTFMTPFLNAGGRGPRELTLGMRGEYSADYERKPSLYLSPIDNRVHLLYADGGVWNLGNGQLLRVANLDGDAFIDAWWRESVPVTPGRQRAQNGILQEALYRVDDLLIYAGTDGLRVRRSAFSPTLSTPAIPTDRRSWATFLEEVPTDPPRDPTQLESWLDDFSGETLELSGVTLRDLRSTPTHLSFELRVQADAELRGDLALPALSGMAPGRYVVHYDRASGRWSRETATAPKPTFELTTSSLRTFMPGTLELTIHNGGTTALQGAATLKFGPRVVRRWEELRLEGKGTWHETMRWLPEHPGTWPATLELGDETFSLDPITIRDSPRVAELDAFLLPLGGRSLIAPLLGLFVLLAATALWRTWRYP